MTPIPLLARVVMALGVMTVLGIPARLGAQSLTNYTWTNLASEAWSQATNWQVSPGVPVSSTNTVLTFTNDGINSYTATNDFLPPFVLNQLVFTNSAGAGTISLAGGALQFSSTGVLQPRLLQLGAGAVNVANDLILSNNLLIAGGGSGQLLLGGSISGAGGLIVASNSNAALAGSNSYSGATLIGVGSTLVISHASALGAVSAGTTVSNGASLQLTNNISVVDEALSLNGAGVGGGGALRNLGGANVFSGVVSLLGNTRINSDAGLLTLDSANPITGAGFTLTLGGAGDLLVNSAINTVAGGLIKDGTGTATLGVSNAYTGATIVSNGTLALGADNVLADAGALTISGGTFDINSRTESVGVVTLNSGTIAGTSGILTGATYNFVDGNVTAQLGGAAGISKTIAGTVSLGGSNSYVGATLIGTNNALRIAHSFALGATGSGTTVSNGASLELSNNIVVTGEAISVTGDGLGGAGALRNRAGSNVLAGPLTLAGATRITSDAGTLVLDSVTPITGSGFALTFASNGNITVNSAINTGAGSVIKTNGGLLVLGGSNTYTGGTFINGGVLQVTSNANLGAAAGGINFDGGTLRTGAGITNTRAIVLNTGNGTFDANGFNSALNGLISGVGGFTKLGDGTLNLRGTNTYGGAGRTNVIAGGVLNIVNLANLGNAANSITISNGASLQFNSTLSIARGITVGLGGGVLDVVSGFIVTNSVAVTGATAFVKAGGGSLVLSNTTANRTGSNIVRGGTLQLDQVRALGTGQFFLMPGGTLSSSAIGQHTNQFFLSGGTLAGTRNSLGAGDSNRAFIGQINVVSNSTLSVMDQRNAATNVDFVFRGQLNGTGQLNIVAGSAPGSLILTNGSNTFSGQFVLGSNVSVIAGHTNYSTNGFSNALGAASVVMNDRSFLSIRIGDTNTNIVTTLTNFLLPNAISVVSGMATVNVNRVRPNSTLVNNLITLPTLGLTNGTLAVTVNNGYQLAFASNTTIQGNSGVAPQAGASLGLGGAVIESAPGASFTKTGAGTAYLTNVFDSTYSGGTIINQGTLLVYAGTNTNTLNLVTNPLGTGVVRLDGGTLQIRTDGTQVLGPGLGYDFIAGTNPLAAGTLNVDRVSTNGGAGRTVTFGNLTLGTNQFSVSSGNTYSVRFQGGTTLLGDALFNNAANLSLVQPISDGGAGYSVTKINAGTLLLTNRVPQLFGGALTIRAGTVRIDSGSVSNSGLFGAQPTVILAGGALELRTDSFSGTFTTTNGQPLNILQTNNGQSIFRVDRSGGASQDRIISINNLTLTNGARFRTEGGNNYTVRVTGTTTLGTNTSFDVANARVNNPFSLDLAGPIVDGGGVPSALRKAVTGNILGYSGTNNPTFSGGTFNSAGAIQWRVGNLPSGTYQFGSGPITLDGNSSFGFLNNVTTNYNFLNKFIINGTVTASGNPLAHGAGTIDSTSQGNSPQVFYRGPVDIRGALTVSAGAVGGSYGTNIFPAVFTGPFNVFGADRRIFIASSGLGTGARVIFSNSLVDDGISRTISVIANNNSSAEFSGTNTAFNGSIRISHALQGGTGRIIFGSTNALPGGKVIVDPNAYAGLRFDPAAFGLSNLFTKFQFAPDAILGLETSSAVSIDLSPGSLNRDIRIGTSSGFTSTYTGQLTPFGSVFKVGGGGGTIGFSFTNGFRDLGPTNRSLDVNPNPFGSPIAGVAASTVNLNSSNNYSGGTVLNAGTLQITVGRANTPLGTGRVDTYALLTATGASGSFADNAGSGNNNLIVTHPGSEIRLDNANSLNINRWGDAVPVELNGATFRIIGRNNAGSSTPETMGDISFAHGSVVTISGSATPGALATTLTASNLLRVGNGTLHLTRSTGTGLEFGNSNKLILATAPALSNGIVAPYLINTNDNTFLSYGANGFTNATYSGTNNLDLSLATDVVTITNLTMLSNDAVAYALRANQSISAGTSSNLTIASGGVIFGASATHSNLNFIFGDGITPAEALLFTAAGTTTRLTNATLSAASITKFGDGTLRLDSDLAYTNGWNINRGTVLIGNLAAGALGVVDAANFVNLNGGVTLQFSATNTNAFYLGGKISSLNNNTLTLDFGGGINSRQTFASGLEFNSVSNGPLGSALRLNLSGARNQFNLAGPVTLNSDAWLNVVNSSSISGGSNRAIFGGVLISTNRTLTKFGNGTLVLSNDSSATFTGSNLRVVAGTLGVENSGALGGPGSTTTISEGAVLEIGYTVTNFAPTATLIQAPGSAERWLHRLAQFSTVTSPETYVVPTNVNLQIVANLTLSNKTIQLNGGSIEAYNFTDSTNGNSIGAGVTIQLGADSKIGQTGVELGRAGVVFTNFGSITETGGPRSLTKIGLDTVVLAGVNSYTGPTIVNQGTLRLATPFALSSLSALVITNQATLDLASNNLTVAGLMGNGLLTNSSANQPALTMFINGSNYWNGSFGGAFDLVKAGTGNLTLAGNGDGTGSRQVYGGAVYVSAQSIGNFGPLGNAGSTIILGDNDSSVRLLTTGPFSVPQRVTVEGNFTGGSKILGGASADVSTFSGSLQLIDNLVLTAAAGGRVNFTGNITESGGAGLTKIGAGTVSLEGNNQFSGQTSISEGTLLVNNTVGSATGLGLVFADAGTTLGGSGRIAGSVLIGDGGRFKPGNSAGAIRIEQDLTLASSATMTFEIGGLIPTNTHDFVSVGGSVFFDGMMEITLIDGYLPATNTTWTLMEFSGKTANFANVVNGARLTSFDNLGSFQVNYSTTNLTLASFQYTDTGTDGIYDAWAMKHFGVTNLAVGTGPAQRDGDFDRDGQSNYAEFIAGTNPTNEQSYLHITSVTVSGTANLAVRWDVADEATYRTPTYQIQYTTNLATWQTITNPAVTLFGTGTWRWIDNGTETGGTAPLDLPEMRHYRVLVK